MLIKTADIVVYLIEMLIAYIFWNGSANRRHSRWATLLIGTALFETGALVDIFAVSTVWLNVLLSLSIMIVYAFVCFRIGTIRGMFYSVMLVAVSTLLELITIFAVSSLSSKYVSDYQSYPAMLVFEVITSKIFYFIAVLVILRFLPGDEPGSKVSPSFFIYPATTIAAIVCFWYICSREQVDQTVQLILAVVGLGLFAATVFTCFIFQYNAKRDKEIILLQRQRDKSQTDLSYFKILEKQNDDLRTYAHDARNHLTEIKNINSDPEVDKYISRMADQLSSYSKVCHSGNRLLNVMIDRYMTECAIDGISFTYDVNNNDLASIEYYDLVTILGNLLDNAIEAAVLTDDKFMTLETDWRNDISVIIIRNSCAFEPRLDSAGRPVTTKSDNKVHGIGLRSVEKTLKTMNGYIACNYERKSNVFTTTVMINSHKDKNSPYESKR